MQPNPTHATGHGPQAGHEEEEMAHHLSPWPAVAAFGGTLLAVGIVLHPIVAFLGAIATFVGVGGWVREDMHFYDHPMPELFHHGKAPNPFWGIILFLGTEVVLFGALFAAYFHGRSTAAMQAQDFFVGHAGEHVDVPIVSTGINTLILITSGATMHWAMHSIQHENRRNFKIGLVLTLFLGGTFLAIQVREYLELIHEGLTLSSSLFGSTFYALTGTHGFHVFGGLLAILFVAIRAFAGQFSKDKYLLVEAAAFYWHFVDVVWVFLYAVIYLKWI